MQQLIYDSNFITGTEGEWTGFIDDKDKKILDTGRERIFSAFAQMKHRFNDNWIVNFGGRFDKKERHKGETLDEFSPRFALIWIPDDEKFDVKFSYSRAFVDAPYWYRYNILPSYRGGKFLEPEYMDSIQLTPTIKFGHGKIISSFNIFYNKFSDFIWRNNNAADNEPIYQNSGILKVGGLENETRYQGNGYNIAFNFTYQKAISSNNFPDVLDDKIWNVPNWTANVVFNLNPFKLLKKKPKNVSDDLWLNLTARYIGEQLSPINIAFDNGVTFNEPNNEVDDVLLFNTGFRWKNFWKDFFLDARVYNLLDQEYYQGGSVSHPYPQPGRWFMITVGLQADW
jgi:outer membrane receptor for ferrienterochelin and colicins